MGGNQNLSQDLSLSDLFICEDATERAEGNEAYEQRERKVFSTICAEKKHFLKNRPFFYLRFVCPHGAHAAL
jgi:hypothetical protein